MMSRFLSDGTRVPIGVCIDVPHRFHLCRYTPGSLVSNSLGRPPPWFTIRFRSIRVECPMGYTCQASANSRIGIAIPHFTDPIED